MSDAIKAAVVGAFLGGIVVLSMGAGAPLLQVFKHLV